MLRAIENLSKQEHLAPLKESFDGLIQVLKKKIDIKNGTYIDGKKIIPKSTINNLGKGYKFSNIPRKVREKFKKAGKVIEEYVEKALLKSHLNKEWKNLLKKC